MRMIYIERNQMIFLNINCWRQRIAIHAWRPTYVNRGDGRASNHIPDVVHLTYGRRGCRRGRQHHFARHPRLFSTTASPRKTLLASFSTHLRSNPNCKRFKLKNCNALHLLRFFPMKIFLIYFLSGNTKDLIR